MVRSKARKRVTVRSAEDLGRALGLSTADTAEMEFRSELTVALAKIIHSGRAADPCRNRQERRNVKNASDRNCECVCMDVACMCVCMYALRMYVCRCVCLFGLCMYVCCEYVCT